MKRITLLSLAVCMIVSLSGCFQQQRPIQNMPEGPQSYTPTSSPINDAAQRMEYFNQLRAEAPTADCGPYPKSYQKLTIDAVRQRLKDPTSAKFKIHGKPEKSYSIDHTDFASKTTVFCWRVGVEVNAKNSFGGYTGDKTWLVYIRDGLVISVVNSEDY